MLNRGFTLIELIVVFSTIAFLSTVGIVSYVSYSQSQSVESEIQKLITTIELAKSRANSQVKPLVCVGQLDGYNVKIENANQYSLNVVCDGISYPLQTITLSNNIEFTPDSLSKTVFFAVITGAVSGNGNFAMTGYNQDRCITVDSVGITEQRSSLCPPPTPTPIPPTPTNTPTPTITPTPTPIPTATPTPTSAPTPTPTPTPVPTCQTCRVFVTRDQIYNGNLRNFVKTYIDAAFSGNGLAAGDLICQTRADEAGIGGTWVAWLSTGLKDARSRISNGKYILLNNATVADNLRDLIDGSLDTPINIDEFNQNVGGNAGVWTGTRSDGTTYRGDGSSPDTCADWSSSSDALVSATGDFTRNDVHWTHHRNDITCQNPFRLYCFELLD